MGSKNFLFLFLLGFLNVSCESAGTGTPVPIPDVQIDCDNTKCTTVATGSYEVVVNVTLSGCAVDQIETIPVIVGTVNVTCINGSGCTGTVSSWRDTNGATETEVTSRTYSVCGWIDFDGISGKSVGDAFADESLLISTSTITLTDWGASNYSRAKSLKDR